MYPSTLHFSHAVTPEDALRNFLAAAVEGDLDQMSHFAGTHEGPLSTECPADSFYLRFLALMFQDVSYEVLPGDDSQGIGAEHATVRAKIVTPAAQAPLGFEMVRDDLGRWFFLQTPDFADSLEDILQQRLRPRPHAV